MNPKNVHYPISQSHRQLKEMLKLPISMPKANLWNCSTKAIRFVWFFSSNSKWFFLKKLVPFLFLSLIFLSFWIVLSSNFEQKLLISNFEQKINCLYYLNRKSVWATGNYFVQPDQMKPASNSIAPLRSNPMVQLRFGAQILESPMNHHKQSLWNRCDFTLRYFTSFLWGLWTDIGIVATTTISRSPH